MDFHVSKKEKRENFIGFPNTFCEPYLVLKILSFLEFLDSYEDDSWVSNDLEYFGYFEWDDKRQVYFLFPSITINRKMGEQKNLFLTNLRYVKSLTLRDIDRHEMRKVVEYLKKQWEDVCLLHYLRVIDCVFENDEYFDDLIYFLPSERMHTLEFEGCAIYSSYGTIPKFEGKLTDLKKLSLVGVNVINEDFLVGHPLQQLRSLKLSHHTAANMESVTGKHFSKLKNLRELELLEGTSIQEWSELETLEKLETLIINEQKKVDGSFLKKTITRVKKLVFRNISEFINFPIFYHDELPCLEHAEIAYGTRQMDSFLWSAPDVILRQSKRTSVPNLKHFEIECHPSFNDFCLNQLFELSNHSNLETLDFCVFQQEDQVGKKEKKYEPVHLPHVRKLVYRDDFDYSDLKKDLLRYFSFDRNCLKEIRIGGNQVSHGRGEKDIVEFLSMFSHGLEKLIINEEESFYSGKMDLEVLFQQVRFPKLKELYLLNYRSDVSNAELYCNDKFLAECWTTKRTGSYPELEVLVMTGFDKLNDQLFQSEVTNLFPKLKSLKLVAVKSITGKDWCPSLFDEDWEGRACPNFFSKEIPKSFFEEPKESPCLCLRALENEEIKALFPPKLEFVKDREYVDYESYAGGKWERKQKFTFDFCGEEHATESCGNYDYHCRVREENPYVSDVVLVEVKSAVVAFSVFEILTERTFREGRSRKFLFVSDEKCEYSFTKKAEGKSGLDKKESQMNRWIVKRLQRSGKRHEFVLDMITEIPTKGYQQNKDRLGLIAEY